MLAVDAGISIRAGLCQSTSGAPVANPVDSTGAHVYQNGAQSGPANQLIGGQQYIIAATENGATLTYWYCTYPTISCSSAPSVGGLPATYTGASGFIGADSTGAQAIMNGFIWNVVIYPTALAFSNPAQLKTLAASYATANPYPSPSPPIPGPLALSASSVSFAGPTSTPTSVGITDPNNTNAFTATSPTPAGIASASITGSTGTGTLTVGPAAGASPGSATLLVGDGFNSVPLTVNVAATAAPTPIVSIAQPYFSNSNPGAPTPFATTLPTPGTFTWSIQVKCNANTVGNAIGELGSEAYMEAGECNSPVANPTSAAGSHLWVTSAAQQAVPANALSAGQQYSIFGTDDGTFLTYYYCTFPFTACTSAQTTLTTPGPATYTTTASIIGAADAVNSRLFSGDEWNFKLYNSALSSGTVATIAASASQIADPYPSPTATATAGTFPQPYTLFTGNSPFRHLISTLEANPNGPSASVNSSSSSIVANWWALGIKSNNQPGQNTPIYISHVTDPTYQIICTYANYVAGGCDANNTVIHIPSAAILQNNSDHHIDTIDTTLSKDFPLWGSSAPAPGCARVSGNPGTITCAWGGYLSLASSGLVIDSAPPASNVYSNGNAAGYAFPWIQIFAQDLLNFKANGTHIPHAIGITGHCDDQTRSAHYPSQGQDNPCSGLGGAAPNIVYGDILHLKSSFSVPSSASAECQAILWALKDYGAYFFDTDPVGTGTSLAFEDPSVETVIYPSLPNPWFNTIFPDMVAKGEGSGTDINATNSSCLEYTAQSNWEVITLNGMATSTLPPIGTP